MVLSGGQSEECPLSADVSVVCPSKCPATGISDTRTVRRTKWADAVGVFTGSRDIVMILRWDEKMANNIMHLGAAASIMVKKTSSST